MATRPRKETRCLGTRGGGKIPGIPFNTVKPWSCKGKVPRFFKPRRRA